MTDRELLEAAARAAGYVGRTGTNHRGEFAFCIHSADGGKFLRHWNPLKDDGDALRLAVKLGFISPGRWPDAGLVALDQWADKGGAVDWYAATRRAIVRAAAALGEQA